MLEAAKEIESFTTGKIRAHLDLDRKLSLSIIRLLEIIGEAAGRVSSDMRQKYSFLPWDAVIGMRNRLIHAYFDVDLDIVWETVKRDIPSLISHLETIIKEEK
jgi:uncharacterized protein with HEPN domain